MDRPDDRLIPAETPWLNDPGAQALCRAVKEAGHRIYFVGGCVRNAVMGTDASDVDLATDALPETVQDITAAAGFRPVPTGIDHGTITVVVDGRGYEVTTFRKDVATDGRRATVAYSKDIADDARRRDFTMNALYATPRGDIVDPLDGLDDARARRVRFIENADQRIREDYLRILRFFRFSAWYADPDHGFELATLDAIARNLDGLDRLSEERLGHELLKLLSAPDPAPAVATMEQLGVLGHVLPGAVPDFLAPLVHLEHQLGVAPDPITRLAALGGAQSAARLRLSRAQSRRLKTLSEALAAPDAPLVLGYRLGGDDAVAVLLLRAAMAGQPMDDKALADVARGAKATFPVRAADLADRFSGPELGAELRRREAEWLASDLSLTRAQLLR